MLTTARLSLAHQRSAMNKNQMNGMYADYLREPSTLDALLIAVRRKAVAITHDDDFAQEFTVGVWQALPIPRNENFSAWINVRLRMKNLNWIRDKENLHEVLACDLLIPSDDGTWERSLNERLDYFASLAYPDDEADLREWLRVWDKIVKIKDPVIRRIAKLLFDGNTRAEVLVILGMNENTLKTKLRRYREKNKKVAA
jgi:DNA-directed RNA polymerase specialized sigma24 family protein